MHIQSERKHPAHKAIHWLTLWLLLIPGLLVAHPGPLDDNGGHYDQGGMSYHCHMGNCSEPDTFTRGNRDSFFLDPNSRDKFYNEADWPLFEGNSSNCRSIRQTILVLTSRETVSFTNPRECEVRTGSWIDEYTGKRFTVASQLELDHIIPRRYAHNQGGDRWPPGKKFQFANDPMNLIMVERREARRKADKGPSGYLPREEFQCEYAQQWRAVADKYDLRLNTRDSNRILVILRGCTEDRSTISVDEDASR
jgi:hypothetical protein